MSVISATIIIIIIIIIIILSRVRDRLSYVTYEPTHPTHFDPEDECSILLPEVGNIDHTGTLPTPQHSISILMNRRESPISIVS
jgi:hypothetical protein